MKYFPRVLSSINDESLFCLKTRNSLLQLKYGQSVLKFYKQHADVNSWFKNICAQSDIPFAVEEINETEDSENSFYIAADVKQIKYLLSESERLNQAAFAQLKMAEAAVNNYSREYSLDKDNFSFIKPNKTSIMGILNITPDSFSDGGEYFDEDKAIERAESITAEGADILDVGGQSSRPGAESISPDEEMRRVIPIINKISSRVNIPVSIDTYRSEVAWEALQAGASMINDISALTFDEKMTEVAAKKGCPVVLMHMQGSPLTMQKNPYYESVCDEIFQFLYKKCEYAKINGIEEGNIIIDPGIGFGKSVLHNLEILKELESFRSLGYPVLVGTSRKFFIGSILDLPVYDRLEGTLSSVVLCSLRRASIVRVHDVKEVKRAVMIVNEIMKA